MLETLAQKFKKKHMADAGAVALHKALDDASPSMPPGKVVSRTMTPKQHGLERVWAQQENKEFRERAFGFAMIALAARLAASDGAYSLREYDMFCALFPMPQLPKAVVQTLFETAGKEPHDPMRYASQVTRLFPGQPRFYQEVVNKLVQIAQCDGALHENERLFLEKLAQLWDVNVMPAALAPSTAPAPPDQKSSQLTAPQEPPPHSVPAYRDHLPLLASDHVFRAPSAVSSVPRSSSHEAEEMVLLRRHWQ